MWEHLEYRLPDQNRDEEPEKKVQIEIHMLLKDRKSLTLVRFSLVTLTLYFICGRYPEAVTVMLYKPGNNNRQ
jgi:hypothetical protein